jgi:hypothetical protein
MPTSLGYRFIYQMKEELQIVNWNRIGKQEATRFEVLAQNVPSCYLENTEPQ